MNNYHYIIASLPILSQNKEDSAFNYRKIRDEISSQLSEEDLKAVALMEKGFNSSNLNQAYYQEVAKSSNKFLRLYNLLDMAIRNKKVEALAQSIYGDQAAEKIEKYSISLPADPLNAYKEPKDVEAALDKFDNQALDSIFAMSDILEKEKRLDDFKWEKINSFTSFDFFNLSSVLAFLVKGSMIQRWNSLDASKGKELFKRLIDEVRGIFNKDKLIYKIDEHNG